MKPPKASEPLRAWVSAFEQAVASGSCAQLKVVYPDAISCQQVLAGYRSAHLIGSEQFGTGALVDFGGTSAQSSNGPVRQLTLFLTLAPSGKWQAIDSQGLGHSTVDTHSSDLAPFKTAASESYGAVASRNCATAYALSMDSGSEGGYCAGLKSSPVVQVIASNPHPRTMPLGGTADVQFFGYFLTMPKSLAQQFQHGDRNAYMTLAVTKVPAGIQASRPYLTEAEQPGPPPSR